MDIMVQEAIPSHTGAPHSAHQPELWLTRNTPETITNTSPLEIPSVKYETKGIYPSACLSRSRNFEEVEIVAKTACAAAKNPTMIAPIDVASARSSLLIELAVSTGSHRKEATTTRTAPALGYHLSSTSNLFAPVRANFDIACRALVPACGTPRAARFDRLKPGDVSRHAQLQSVPGPY